VQMGAGKMLCVTPGCRASAVSRGPVKGITVGIEQLIVEHT